MTYWPEVGDADAGEVVAGDGSSDALDLGQDQPDLFIDMVIRSALELAGRVAGRPLCAPALPAYDGTHWSRRIAT